MEKQTVFRKVSVKDRLPSKRSSYLTNKGMYKWCKKYGFYNESLFNIYKVNNIKWWLEEIDLPSDDEIEETKAEAGTSMWWHDKGFENGFKACLNMINYVTNR